MLPIKVLCCIVLHDGWPAIMDQDGPALSSHEVVTSAMGGRLGSVERSFQCCASSGYQREYKLTEEALC